MLLQSNSPFAHLWNASTNMAPVDTGGGSATSSPMGVQDILSELNKADADEEPEVIELPKPSKKTDTEEKEKEEKTEDTEETDETEKKDDEETEEDELAELEKELEGPSEEQLELMTPARRKDILKAYPDLFKKFPYLQTAYYRDQKFTEIFPTIKEAETAVSDLKEYNEIKENLSEGNIEGVITNIGQNTKAFYKMVDNYMPTLAKVSPEAYHHVIGNLIKHTVEQMVSEGNNKNNDNLKIAATVLHEFVFGTTQWQPPSNLSRIDKEESDKETELQRRERDFVERRFNTAQSEVATRVDNAIKATIDMHIDPDKQMTDYIKQTASEKALKQVESLIVKDARFKAILDRLWQNAADKDFDKTEMDKIKAACVAKARTLLPSVIQAARREALKGLSKRIAKSEREEEVEETPQSSKGKSATPITSGKRTGGKQIPAGLSTLEAMDWVEKGGR